MTRGGERARGAASACDERVGGVGRDREQQAAGRLRVGEQQLLGLGERAPVDELGHERVVPLRATGDDARREQVAHTVDHRYRAGVDHRAPTPEPARELAQVTEQTEAGDVGGRVHRVAELDGRVARAGVQRGHDVDRGLHAARRSRASRFTAVEITPSPIGFVSTRRSPGRAPEFVSTWSGCDGADDREPVLRLGVVDRVAAARRARRRRDDVGATVEHAASSSKGSPSRGHATRFSASSGVPPIAYTSDSALVAAMRPQSYGSSTIGVKKSVVRTMARSSRTRYTAASSAVSRPTSRFGSSGGVEAADEPEHGAQVGGGELAGAARAV